MRFPETLVLGATGRIGQLLQQVWPQRGHGNKLLWQSRHPQRDKSLNWEIFDPLATPEALERAATGRADILCLAGAVPGRGRDLADNWRLAEVAVRAAARTGARVLLTSSAAVYGNQAGVLDEAAVLCPINEYGRAKVDMEQRAVALAAQLGVDCCCLRIGNIAGFDAILGGWRPGFQLDRFADGRTPTRSYIGVRGLAEVLADLLMAPKLPPALNVAAPGAIEMGALLDAAGLQWQPRQAPDGAIPGVELAVDEMQQLIAVPHADPTSFVTEWRWLEPLMVERHAN